MKPGSFIVSVRYEAPRIGAHRVKKITVKRGQDKLGRPIDEKQVDITSNVADDHLETDAEIEALS